MIKKALIILLLIVLNIMNIVSIVLILYRKNILLVILPVLLALVIELYLNINRGIRTTISECDLINIFMFTVVCSSLIAITSMFILPLVGYSYLT